MKEPSAGEREGEPLACKEPSAGEREGEPPHHPSKNFNSPPTSGIPAG